MYITCTRYKDYREGVVTISAHITTHNHDSRYCTMAAGQNLAMSLIR